MPSFDDLGLATPPLILLRDFGSSLVNLRSKYLIRQGLLDRSLVAWVLSLPDD
jgi:hypothetical protein